MQSTIVIDTSFSKIPPFSISCFFLITNTKTPTINFLSTASLQSNPLSITSHTDNNGHDDDNDDNDDDDDDDDDNDGDDNDDDDGNDDCNDDGDDDDDHSYDYLHLYPRTLSPA